jgi:hypothetical protein
MSGTAVIRTNKTRLRRLDAEQGKRNSSVKALFFALRIGCSLTVLLFAIDGPRPFVFSDWPLQPECNARVSGFPLQAEISVSCAFSLKASVGSGCSAMRFHADN